MRRWPAALAPGLPFAADRFSYAGVPPPASEAGLGYAGLRLHTNLNSADYRDELIVFQGANKGAAFTRREPARLGGPVRKAPQHDQPQ